MKEPKAVFEGLDRIWITCACGRRIELWREGDTIRARHADSDWPDQRSVQPEETTAVPPQEEP